MSMVKAALLAIVLAVASSATVEAMRAGSPGSAASASPAFALGAAAAAASGIAFAAAPGQRPATKALDALGVEFPPAERKAYQDAVRSLQRAFISSPPYQRPVKVKAGRGSSAGSTGHRSWMKAGRYIEEVFQSNPFAHFTKAKTLPHPKARDKVKRSTPADISAAIDFALSKGVHKLRGFRRHQLVLFNDISSAMEPLTQRALVQADRPSHVVDVAPRTHVALLAAMSDATSLDSNLARDFLLGFQMTGHVPSSMMHREIAREDDASHSAKCEALQDGAWSAMLALESSIARHGSSAPQADRDDLLRVTQDQVAAGSLAGPFTRREVMARLHGHQQPKRSAGGTPVSPVCSRRFGVRQGEKYRPCEDWKANGQNDATSLGETISPITFEEPAFIAEEIRDRALRLGKEPPALSIAIDDVSRGYNNMPTDREYVMIMWHEAAQAPRYYTSKCMMFGSTASVNHFVRLPLMIERISSRMFATVARSYIDDWIITDYQEAGDSAQLVLGEIHANIRIPLARCDLPSCIHCNAHASTGPQYRSRAAPAVKKCKRRNASPRQELLGVVCDISRAHEGVVIFSPKPSRCRKILDALRTCKTNRRISQAVAQHLVGKLSFIIHSSLFGSVGRAQTLPFHRRSQGKSEDGRSTDASEEWTPRMSASLAFLETILREDQLPSRQIAFGDDEPVIIYTDAAGQDLGIGIVAWDPVNPDTTWVASALCPQWIRGKLLEYCPADDEGNTFLINPVEMLGSLAALLTFHDLVRGRRVWMFQDNAAAFNCAVSGSGRSPAVLCVGNLFHTAAAALQTGLWTEHVDSAAQLADIPSRERHAEPHQHQAEFDRLGCPRRTVVFPSQEDWESPQSLFDRLCA
jgi:hypothetical protein